ncbi:DNA topoisomerase III [Thalassotalea maritima]|uniref:DNA topoisomerase III n=1 Tax=Thalassotalea maritima TaxID=3242416 RepID=UPI00352890B5
MKLYIAEKPSLARAIVAALPKPHKKADGYIEVGNGDVVSWCIGHILEQAEPEKYDEKYKKWQQDHLPIIPQQWALQPKYKTRSQLSVLRKLVTQCSQLVHAGDPDREGQLLVDEVLDYLKVGQQKKQQCQRLLVSDLNTPAVKRSLANLASNTDFISLSVSALARSRADWLYGINLTRAYTLAGQKSGYNSVLSVGRVQTPILGLVVERDNNIDNFVAKDHYQVLAHVIDKGNQTIKAKWQPSEACSPYMDDEGRVLHKALADNVVRRIGDQPAKVMANKQQQKKQFAPLPYNLSALQIDAAKAFNMNAKQVLDTCQSLYEKHKLITYPRSDCRYLPSEHFQQATSIISAISASENKYQQACKGADRKRKSKAFNDVNVGAHHAIVPTEKVAKLTALSKWELQIYEQICGNYLSQFYPPYVYQQGKLELTIAGGMFVATSKITIDLGYKALFANQQTQAKQEERDDNEASNASDFSHLSVGDELWCKHGELLAKQTQPPAAFTDATLLQAMTGIARFVNDPSIKAILKETDGLGTEATRAGIMELLFKRGYLQRQGKAIKATDVGKALINALPAMATKPDLTAKWEADLTAIVDKKMSYQQFMQPLTEQIRQFIELSHQQDFSGLPNKPFKANKRRRSQASPSKKSRSTTNRKKSAKMS